MSVMQQAWRDSLISDGDESTVDILQTLLDILPEVQEALSGEFDGIECSLGPGPDLASKPFYLPFSYIGKQVTFIPDVSLVDNDGLDTNGLHRIPLVKSSAVYTDGQSGASLELVLGRGSNWKTPLTNLFAKLYPSKWSFLILELENGHSTFHVLSSAHPHASGPGRREDTPDSVDPHSVISSQSECSDATNFTLWVVPITRIFAIPPPKKKIIKRVVKKKSPAVEGVPGENGTLEKKKIVRKVVKKTDGEHAEKALSTERILATPSPSLVVSDSTTTLVASNESLPDACRREEREKKEREEEREKEKREWQTEKVNGYLNGQTNGYTATNGDVVQMPSSSSSSAITSPTWTPTSGVTNGLNELINGITNGLERSPSAIRREEFNHAATRTRSARLQQRLASLDRDNGIERSSSNISVFDRERSSIAEDGPSKEGSDSVSDLRKRLNGLGKDNGLGSMGSSSSINEKFQSALLASRRLGQGESGQLTPSRSRSRVMDAKSRSPPLGPIFEGRGRKDRQTTPPRTVIAEVVCRSNIGDMPFAVLKQVLERVSYKELGRLRQVHPHLDELCGQMLNSGYYKLIEKCDKLLMQLQRKVQADSGLYYPTSVLTNIQVHILNPVDIMRAALDEGVCCFPYGVLLDKTNALVDQVRLMADGGSQIDVAWEPVAMMAKKAAMHYKTNLEHVMEDRMGEAVRLKAAQKIIRMDSFLVESTVQKLQEDTFKTKDDLMWEIEQLQQQNVTIRRENRQLKQDHMKLEARIEILEGKFKTMSRLLS